MKLLFSIFLLIFSISVFGQASDQITKWKSKILNDTDLYKQEYKDSYKKYDFGSLWTQTDNGLVYGIIGENFQRIRIKILTAIKDTIYPDIYYISGKSMVKNNVCQFNGTIKIITIRGFKNPHLGVDNEYKDIGFEKQGILVAEYHFSEDSTQVRSCAHSLRIFLCFA